MEQRDVILGEPYLLFDSGVHTLQSHAAMYARQRPGALGRSCGAQYWLSRHYGEKHEGRITKCCFLQREFPDGSGREESMTPAGPQQIHRANPV